MATVYAKFRFVEARHGPGAQFGKAVVAGDIFTPFRMEQRLHGQRQGARLLPGVVFERLMTQEPCGAGERLALILVLVLKQVDVAQFERAIEPQGQGRAVLRIMRLQGFIEAQGILQCLLG